ncbi:hypothetical protein B4113_0228 [Geobacillus sp. B4113_201601]|nr:hypothetical protein B4113_0228 [Geobacillus sp. B4113_201601]
MRIARKTATVDGRFFLSFVAFFYKKFHEVHKKKDIVEKYALTETKTH